MHNARSPLTSVIQSALHNERRTASDRRDSDRRQRADSPPNGERRSGHDRRRLQRRENSAGHLRNALQVLVHLMDHTDLDDESAELVRSAVRRIALALREIERQRMARHN